MHEPTCGVQCLGLQQTTGVSSKWAKYIAIRPRFCGFFLSFAIDGLVVGLLWGGWGRGVTMENRANSCGSGGSVNSPRTCSLETTLGSGRHHG